MSDFALEDVFGIQRDIHINYIVREDVDNTFIESLSRNKHIVIYGSSKQGKTCLRKKYLSQDNCIMVHCSNKLNISQLNELILKQAGFKITLTEKKSFGNNYKVSATAGFKLFAKAEATGEYNRESNREVESKSLEIDLEDVNDIIQALKSISFSKFIVLEDFHYLKKETQLEFTIALKTYYDNSSFIFIIVGVWLEHDRLICYNGDLSGRIISINADVWGYEDLIKAIEYGGNLLNIKFNEDLVETIINESFNNVSFVQEICYRICQSFKIKKSIPSTDSEISIDESYIDENGDLINTKEDKDDRFYIHKHFDINSILKKIIDQHSGRYNSFLVQFADGFPETEFEIYKWILYPILISNGSDLELGINLSILKNKICSKHPNNQQLTLNKLVHALKSSNNLQFKKNIRPNILDYDDTDKKLNIVDRGFIVWLEHQIKSELLMSIGLPTD